MEKTIFMLEIHRTSKKRPLVETTPKSSDELVI